jgi:hypothetical protein
VAWTGHAVAAAVQTLGGLDLQLPGGVGTRIRSEERKYAWCALAEVARARRTATARPSLGEPQSATEAHLRCLSCTVSRGPSCRGDQAVVSPWKRATSMISVRRASRSICRPVPSARRRAANTRVSEREVDEAAAAGAAAATARRPRRRFLRRRSEEPVAEREAAEREPPRVTEAGPREQRPT